MAHPVHGDGHGEDEDRIDARFDLDAIGVAETEPLLRHLGDLAVVRLDLVLVVDDVAVDLQVLTAVDLDLEVVADQPLFSSPEEVQSLLTQSEVFNYEPTS